MIFELSSSGVFYDKKEKEKLEKLGFKFKTTKEVYGKFTHTEFYKESGATIEVNTLEELINFTNKYGSVVLRKDYNDEGFCIELYDDYRE